MIPFVNGTRLCVRGGAHGLTGYLYVGLPDFEESAFALHLLRRGDGFADVGANAGGWTVLAAGGAGAQVKAFEPASSAYQLLAENVACNRLEGLVNTYSVGVGSQRGALHFTTNLDPANHVVSNVEDMCSSHDPTIEIPIVRLDEVYDRECPSLIKIDVEGWELEVIKGATLLLANSTLLALIVETFRQQNVLQPKLQEIEAILAKHGFIPCAYQPFERKLAAVEQRTYESNNTIYVRSLSTVQERLSSAAPFSILGNRI